MVCGSSQGIGLAITKSLLTVEDYDLIIATFRNESSLTELKQLSSEFPKKLLLMKINPLSDESLLEAKNQIGEKTQSIDLLINCIGFLHNEEIMPEKNISEITLKKLLLSFEVNTAPTLLFAKYFKNMLLKQKGSKFVSVSAKVGSISDNKSGGWYSYRASKAALNMCIKNISIEFNRMGKECTVFSLHPGTTETRLSEPFIENARKKYEIHSTESTAQNLLKIILDSENKSHNGKFFSWDGSELPW